MAHKLLWDAKNLGADRANCFFDLEKLHGSRYTLWVCAFDFSGYVRWTLVRFIGMMIILDCRVICLL